MGKIKVVEVVDKKLMAIVESLAYSIWREHYTPIIGRRQVEYMLDKFQSKEAILNQIEKEGYLYYLLEDKNNNLVGYIGVIPKDKELFLSKLYINVENRRKGYGRCALDFIEIMAKDRNLPKITLTVNKNNIDSIEAYGKLGFIITDSIVTDIDGGFVMDDYKMEQVITSSLI